MKRFCVVAAVVCAAAAGPVYAARAFDDRAAIVRAKSIADKLTDLIPDRNRAKTAPDQHRAPALLNQIEQLERLQKDLRDALRQEGIQRAIMRYRERMMKGASQTLDEITKYRRAYGVAGDLQKKMDAVESKRPTNERSRSYAVDTRRWERAMKLATTQLNVAVNSLNKLDPWRAIERFVEMLDEIDGPMNKFYDEGAIGAIETRRAAVPAKHDTYVLKDGRRAEVLSVRDANDRYIISAPDGSVYVVDKTDVAEFVKKGQMPGGAAPAEGAEPDEEAGAALENADADVYVLADGSRIVAATAMSAGKNMVIKDVSGRMHSVKKSDVVEIVRAGGDAEDEGGAGAAGDEPAGPESWRDEVVLKTGEKMRGLIVSDDGVSIVFDIIMEGHAVSRTRSMRTTIASRRVKEVARLTDDERDQARAYLARVAEDTKQDVKAMESVTIESVALTREEAKRFGLELKGKKDFVRVKRVELDNFVIIAGLDERVLDEIATELREQGVVPRDFVLGLQEDFLKELTFRLGQMLQAFKGRFGVDRNADEKVPVVVFSSYNAYHNAIGKKIDNPAFFAYPPPNIWAGFNLAELHTDIATTKVKMAKLNKELAERREKIDEARAEVRKRVNEFSDELKEAGQYTPAGKALMKQIRRYQTQWEVRVMRMEEPLKDLQRRIKAFNKKMDHAIVEHADSLIRCLYHEGWHAYLHCLVFDEKTLEHFPRWLNEGLAQYFESSRVEGGRLIVGQQDRYKMRILREYYRTKQLISLEDMVMGGQDEYLVESILDAEESNKHYNMAWCVVSILGKKGRLKKEHIGAFVKKLAGGASQLEALPTLTGMSNRKLEREIRKLLSSSIRG